MYLVLSSSLYLIPIFIHKLWIIRCISILMFLSSSTYHFNKYINININYILLYIDQTLIFLSILITYLNTQNYIQLIIFLYSIFNCASCYYLICLNYDIMTHGIYLTLSTRLHILMHINGLMGYLSTNL